jgi:hypothetical protein
VLVVPQLHHLGRRAEGLIRFVDEPWRHSVSFRLLDTLFDTSTPTSGQLSFSPDRRDPCADLEEAQRVMTYGIA